MVHVQAAVADPGALDTHSADIDWGDGTIEAVPVVGGTASASHAYADDGVYVATVTVTDDGGDSAQDALVVTVENVAPTIQLSGAASVEEGSPYTLTLGAVTDPGDDTVITYRVHWGDGTTDDFGVAGDMIHTYADGPEARTIVVDLEDEDGTHVGAGSLALMVTNAAPLITADSTLVTVDEGDTAENTGSFSDLGIDTITLAASVGIVTSAGEGKWLWSFATIDGFEDSQTVTITATDSDGASGSVVFQLRVNNAVPEVQVGADLTANEGATVALQAAFRDPGSVDTHSAVVDWGDGMAAETAAIEGNAVRATHVYADDGVYTITVTVTDDDGGAGSGSLHAMILNVPPVASDDSYTVDEDHQLAVSPPAGVLSNDVDVAADPLSALLLTGPAHGILELRGDGAFTYNPYRDFNGTDNFVYTVSDGDGGTDTATVTIAVNPVNDAPVAIDDLASTDEDTPVMIVVLANDADVDGDSLSVASVGKASHGTVAVNPDSTVTYAPALNYTGMDSFVYTVSDGAGGAASATVTIAVGSGNDAPVATDDAATTPEDTLVTIAVLANDSDADGDALSVASVGQGAHGTVVINADGTLTYTPALNYFGTDSFSYAATDGLLLSAPATVTLTVTAVNDAPVAS